MIKNYINAHSHDLKDKLDEENKNLIIHNKKLRDIIFDTDIMHYRRINMQEAINFNRELKTINSELVTKVYDIYDI